MLKQAGPLREYICEMERLEPEEYLDLLQDFCIKRLVLICAAELF